VRPATFAFPVCVMSLRFFSLCAACLALALLCGCEYQRSANAAAAKRDMVGMNKEQVLTCMGPPGKKAHVGETEVWSYRSSSSLGVKASDSQSYGGNKLGGGYNKRYFCDVNVVMKNDQVAVVHYNGPTSAGLFTDDEQCGYAVEHCVHDD